MRNSVSLGPVLFVRNDQNTQFLPALGDKPTHPADMEYQVYPPIGIGIDTGGYGLGLYLWRVIAEAHGGELDIASTLGERSEVTLILPLSNTKG